VDEYGIALRAVLVVADDRLVAERYYDGATRDRFLQLHSATKTVTGLLVGIALADGKLSSVDQTLAETLPPDLRARASEKVRSMTLRGLLSMTSGLGEELPWADSADWARAIVEQPFFAATPGSFEYSSAGSQLLSAVVEHATGESLLAYARKRLFEPLGIATEPLGAGLRPFTGAEPRPEPTFGWAHDRLGHYAGGTGLPCVPSTWPSSACSTSIGESGRESRWCRARGSTPRRGPARVAEAPKAMRTDSRSGSRARRGDPPS
jgi:CubicO group peptidase (beta-lactamase class C family)